MKTNKLYKKTIHTYKIKYIPELLWKYHEFSKKLNHSDVFDNSLCNSTIISKERKEIIYELSQRAKDKAIREIAITSNFYWETDDSINEDHYQLIYPLKDYDRFTEQELLHYHTLLYITKQYVDNDYKMFFIREEDFELDRTDDDIHKSNLSNIQYAYDILKDLRNLLFMRESDLSRIGIVLDQNDDDDKKQKDMQVKITENLDKKALINLQIKNTLDTIRYLGNDYLPSYKFHGKNLDNIESSFVSSIFAEVQPLIEFKKKQPSARRKFKGLLLKIIRQYVTTEEFTITNNIVDSRNQSLLAYELMMRNGLIEFELIKKHKDRDSRIKYIDSLPLWEGDYYSINIH